MALQAQEQETLNVKLVHFTTGMAEPSPWRIVHS